MAGPSNPSSCDATAGTQLEDQMYLYALNANVSNFVSVKLSSQRNYHLWERQMGCLLKSYNVHGIIYGQAIYPGGLSPDTENRFDNLVKGWIFGSISEQLLDTVVDLGSPKEVWDKLTSLYDPITIMTSQKAAAPTIVHQGIKVVVTNPTNPTSPTNTINPMNEEQRKNLHRAALKGDWSEAEPILNKHKEAVKEAICNDGSTILHIAVGKGHKGLTKKLISSIDAADLLTQRSSDGSTALHIAAIVGNTYAADLLVKKNIDLLRTEDHKNQVALHKAYEYLHLNTIRYLSKAADDGAGVQIGVDLLVNAICGKQYNLAARLIKKFPNLAAKNDVLMAIAKTFPTVLDSSEAFFYPYLGNIRKTILSTVVTIIIATLWSPLVFVLNCFRSRSSVCVEMALVPKRIILFVYQVIYCLILIVCFLFLMLYFPMWKAAMILGSANDIKNKKNDVEEAKKVLQLVCDEIDKIQISATRHSYYNKPILVAACEGAYKVVDEILIRSPEAIHSTDEKGYDIIQLAVLHRSDKVYNLIYDIGERKHRYEKLVDSSKNNMLHLAGRLAPTNKLDIRSNPASQLQLEVQWYMEVKKLVFPTYITQENNSMETPEMVFAREHENLLKAGEKWMKSTAKSGNIIAALITTITFAAAITVPGGSDDDGVPVLKDWTAFTVFLIADVISLCASSSAILAFTWVLTAPPAKEYFVRVLPNRMLLGHFCLFLSTTAMMVAFSAITYLVFYDENPWKLAPLCVLVEFPITFFLVQEIPMILGLIWATTVSIFGKRRGSLYIRFHPNNLRMFFCSVRAHLHLGSHLYFIPFAFMGGINGK